VNWWQLAADQKHPQAADNLGSSYEVGIGVLQNNVLAHMWYNLATALGWRGVLGYGAPEVSRARVELLMSPEDIIEAQRLAREWFEAHPN